MGKGEIARNEQFLLFLLCFLSVWRTFCHFHLWNCCLQTLSVKKRLKFVVWERVKALVSHASINEDVFSTGLIYRTHPQASPPPPSSFSYAFTANFHFVYDAGKKIWKQKLVMGSFFFFYIFLHLQRMKKYISLSLNFTFYDQWKKKRIFLNIFIEEKEKCW